MSLRLIQQSQDKKKSTHSCSS